MLTWEQQLPRIILICLQTLLLAFLQVRGRRTRLGPDHVCKLVQVNLLLVRLTEAKVSQGGRDRHLQFLINLLRRIDLVILHLEELLNLARDATDQIVLQLLLEEQGVVAVFLFIVFEVVEV